MRRIGILLLVIGLAIFLIATSQRSGYDTLEGQIKSAVSSEERSKKSAWDTARWLGVGAGVVGLVLVLMPGKKT
jgi:hypothetical protein